MSILQATHSLIISARVAQCDRAIGQNQCIVSRGVSCFVQACLKNELVCAERFQT